MNGEDSDRVARYRKLHAPAPIRDLPLWCVWAYEQVDGEPRPRKVPHYSMGGRRYGQQGSPADREKLTTFAVARDAAAKRGMDGVGFALMPDAGIIALDFDKCVKDGVVDPVVLDLVQGTYAELSPSGTGIRAFFAGAGDVLGDKKSHATPDQFGAEAFSTKGFVTVTGWALDHVDLCGWMDRVAPLPARVIDFCHKRFGAPKPTQDAADFFLGREPPLGLSVGEIEEILSHLDPDCGREEWVKTGIALHHETRGDDTGLALWAEWSSQGGKYPGYENVEYQWRSFRGPIPGRPSITMASVIKMAKEAGYDTSAREWLPPIPLPDKRPHVPPLTEDMLPAELRAWLKDIAERMVVPLDYTGIPAMVMLGALIGRKVCVRPEEFTDWSEPGNLWGTIVASPGAMKTPVVAQVFGPIKQLEAEAQAQNREAQAKHDVALLVHKTAKENALKKARQDALTDPEALLAQCASEPPLPPQKRFMTTDATVEKLGAICADNPNGILVYRDELPTLLLNLQREESALLRGFLLTGWTGLEGYIFDRIGRGTVYVEAANISLFGTAQPQRIASIIADASKKHDDGLVQRLQLLAWPDLSQEWVPIDRAPDIEAREAAFACCRRLAALTPEAIGAEQEAPGAIPFLRLSPDALVAFQRYRAELEAKVRSRSLPEPMAAHLSKYRGLIPRLALVLHLAGGCSGKISGAAMATAIKWAHYLEAHANRAYSAEPRADVAKLILQRTTNGDLLGPFGKRDILQRDWSGLKNADEVDSALALLVEHRWLRREQLKTGGRPSKVYHINPELPSSPAP